MLVQESFFKIFHLRMACLFVMMLFSFSSLAVNNKITITSQQITIKVDQEETNWISVRDNTVKNNNSDKYKKTSILKTTSQPETIANNAEIVALLSMFKNKPDNLDLIKKLTVKLNPLLAYVKQRLDNDVTWSELSMIIEVLSLINSTESTSFLISLGSQYVNNIDLNINILKYLREMPQSEKMDSYINLLLQKNPKELPLVGSILLSMSNNKSSDMNQWIVKYRSPGIEPEIRFLALYLSSLSGKDETLKQWILQIMFDKKKPPVHQHYYLLMALSHLMSDETFHDFLSRSYVSPLTIKSVKLERKFHQGDDKTRMKLALQLVNSRHSDQRIAAISFLLKYQGFEKTWQQLNQKQRLSAIRLSYKMGIPVFIEKDKNKQIINDDEVDNAPAGYRHILFWLTIGIVVMVILRKYVVFREPSDSTNF